VKVVVYVPVAAGRLLEASGEDPALWVRGVVRGALEGLGSVPAPAPALARLPLEPEPAKGKIALSVGGCLMSVPRGVRCKVCGRVH